MSAQNPDFTLESKQLIAETVRRVMGTPADNTNVARPKYPRSSGGRIVPVALSQVGGANGNKTTAPTYTYDLKLFTTTKSGSITLGSTTVGTAQSPMVARPVGTATAATRGLAIPASDGGYALLVAYEKPGSGGC